MTTCYNILPASAHCTVRYEAYGCVNGSDMIPLNARFSSKTTRNLLFWLLGSDIHIFFTRTGLAPSPARCAF
jgi:hypothetical protein